MFFLIISLKWILSLQIENKLLRDMQKSNEGGGGGSKRHSNDQERMNRLMDKNDELAKLLKDSTKTIRELRSDLVSARSSRSEHDNETHENDEKETVFSDDKDSAQEKSPQHPRIPLEPHVEIVNARQSGRRSARHSSKIEKRAESKSKKVED